MAKIGITFRETMAGPFMLGVAEPEAGHGRRDQGLLQQTGSRVHVARQSRQNPACLHLAQLV